MRIARYCRCGASMQVRATPPDVAERFATEFDARHGGEGHGPATQGQAAQARRREEPA